MISMRELEREYRKILKFYPDAVKPNKINCYVCKSCGHITKTIDIDEGVTPMFTDCDGCKSQATAISKFYNDIAPEAKPTMEWYRPTITQCMKYRKLNSPTLEHVLNGGLLCRKISIGTLESL